MGNVEILAPFKKRRSVKFMEVKIFSVNYRYSCVQKRNVYTNTKKNDFFDRKLHIERVERIVVHFRRLQY